MSFVRQRQSVLLLRGVMLCQAKGNMHAFYRRSRFMDTLFPTPGWPRRLQFRQLRLYRRHDTTVGADGHALTGRHSPCNACGSRNASHTRDPGNFVNIRGSRNTRDSGNAGCHDEWWLEASLSGYADAIWKQRVTSRGKRAAHVGGPFRFRRRLRCRSAARAEAASDPCRG